MNTKDLAEKIKNAADLSAEDKASLLELLKNQKKYGLVWEEKEEAVEEELRELIPIVTEVQAKAIVQDYEKLCLEWNENNPSTESLFSSDETVGNIKSPPNKIPNHILIEGDNLHALTVLSYTHAGKIDVIYIDPPYNTGNKDFKYNDRFVDKEDTYRHSKWLSFMAKRLKLAKRLLSDTGVIFISIDDSELAQLKLLIGELFGEERIVAIIPVIMNLKGNQDEEGFAGTHEYLLVLKNYQMPIQLKQFTIDEEDDDWENDDYGFFKKGANLKATGVNAPRMKRPNLFFPIYVNPEKSEIYITENDLPKISSDIKILPITEGNEMSWRWSKKKIWNESHNIIVAGVYPNYSIYKKQRPLIGDLPSKKPKSIFYKPEYSSGNGTAQLKEIFKDKVFNNPKPLELIKDIVYLCSQKEAVILDFFAGSGTTLHATMQLNAEDSGSRQCILVTNNENNICEEVTYERNKKVIAGYTTPKGKQVSGLKFNNLRYYKTSFVGREQTIKNKKELTRLSTEMLKIKEDCYKQVTSFNKVVNYKNAVLFENRDFYLMVIYNEDIIEDCVDEIKKLNKKVRVFVFSNSQYPHTDEFLEVIDKVDLCALPDAIYQAYHSILPKKQKGFDTRNIGENISEATTDLFSEMETE